MNTKSNIIIIFSALALTTCVDVVNLDPGTGERQFVVDGMVTFNPLDSLKTIPDTVRLSYSVPYLDNEKRDFENNAIAIITSSDGQIDTLKRINNSGTYITQKLRTSIGGVYRLDVFLPDSLHYFAVTRINRLADFRRLFTVDTVRTVGPGGPIPAGGFVVIDAWDPAGLGDSYRFKFFVKRNPDPANIYFIEEGRDTNWRFFNKPDQFIIASESGGGGDRSFIDNAAPFVLPVSISINTVVPIDRRVKPAFFPGDRIRVEIWSITQDQLFFYSRLLDEVTKGSGGAFAGLFAEPVGNVPTNIQNANPKSDKKALGWFGGAAIAERTTTMLNYNF